VEERYAVASGTRTFKSQIEVFQVARPIAQVPAGYTLRIMDANRFNAVYTFDDWQTQQIATCRVVGYPGSFVDIPTPPGAAGKLIFTLHWPENTDAAEHWLGHNVEIEVVAPAV
jgi:glucoamylase